MTGFEDADQARFTDWLRERSEPDWTAATDHRFTEELAAGALEDDAFRRYLVRDYQFVETLVLDPARKRRVARNFERAVALEVRFFDAVYE